METLKPDEHYIWQWGEFYTGLTRDHYLRVMLEWLSFCMSAGVHILEADAHLIEAFQKVKPHLSKRSINTRLTPIINFYRWAHTHGYISEDVGARVRRPPSPRRSNLQWLERDQLQQFLDAAKQHDPATHGLVCLMGLNGTRLGETLAVKVQHLESGGRVLWLPDRKLGQADRLGLPKRTRQALHALAGERKTGLLFRAARGGQLTSPTVYKWFDALSEYCGLPFRVRPHMLRATFITLSLEAGVSIRDVMNSAGHSSYSMVAYYDRGYRSVQHNASAALAEWVEGGDTQE